jgi:putative SOS response-associated peptidase YedK
MPVILHAEDEDLWLRGTYAEACELATPHPSQLMAMAPTQKPVEGPAATQEAFLSTEGVVLV